MTETPKKYYIIKTRMRGSFLAHIIVFIAVFFFYDKWLKDIVESYIGEGFQQILYFISLFAGLSMAGYLTERLFFRYLRISFDTEALHIEYLARDKKTILDFKSHHFSYIKKFSDFNFGIAQTFEVTFRDGESSVLYGSKNKKISGDLAELIKDFKAFLKTNNGKEQSIAYSNFYQSRDGKGAFLIAAAVLLGGIGLLIHNTFFDSLDFKPDQLLFPAILIILSGAYIRGHIGKTQGD